MIACALTCVVRTADADRVLTPEFALSGYLGSAVVPTLIACAGAIAIFAIVYALAKLLGD